MPDGSFAVNQCLSLEAPHALALVFGAARIRRYAAFPWLKRLALAVSARSLTRMQVAREEVRAVDQSYPSTLVVVVNLSSKCVFSSRDPLFVPSNFLTRTLTVTAMEPSRGATCIKCCKIAGPISLSMKCGVWWTPSTSIAMGCVSFLSVHFFAPLL